MPIATEVEIDSVRTASWIVGSDPFRRLSCRLFGYIVHIGCPKLICKYAVDKNDDLFYYLKSDDAFHAPLKFSGMCYSSPKFESYTLTIYDMIWIDPEPEDTKVRDKLLGTIHGVIQAFLSDNHEQKAVLIRKWNGV